MAKDKLFFVDQDDQYRWLLLQSDGTISQSAYFDSRTLRIRSVIETFHASLENQELEFQDIGANVVSFIVNAAHKYHLKALTFHTEWRPTEPDTTNQT